jgi:triosephosphate isomerase
MRNPVIAGNWKMFKTCRETSAFFDAFLPQIKDVDHCQIVVAPPYTSLATAVEKADGTSVAISAQDVFWEAQGAFTGEVSVGMLVDVGCTYTIIGHSERRQFFGETDETVEKKTLAAVAGGLKAIVCVGETLVERDGGQAEEVVRRQVRNGLGRLTESDLSHIIVAYEPVWAIGTGRTATPEIAAEAHRFLRDLAASGFGKEQAVALRILYGGSVKPDNIKGLMAQVEIDGALVGGASLDARQFASIVNF